MTETEHSLLVSFPDGSHSFVHGFEAGQIWAQLDSGSVEPIDRGFHTGLPVHSANMVVIQRMAQVRGFKVETKPSEDGWTGLLLTYVGEGRTKPALRVVATGHAEGRADG